MAIPFDKCISDLFVTALCLFCCGFTAKHWPAAFRGLPLHRTAPFLLLEFLAGSGEHHRQRRAGGGGGRLALPADLDVPVPGRLKRQRVPQRVAGRLQLQERRCRRPTR